MNIKKLSILGIFFFLEIFNNNALAQSCDDSTCVGYVPLHNQTLQHTYTRQLPFNYNPARVTYNYMTSVCPAGYQGQGGGAGYIHERQTVLTYPGGAVHIGEWTVYDDNCEEIPPKPAHPQDETIIVWSCSTGYAQNRDFECTNPDWMSSPLNRTYVRWVFEGYDSNGEPYGKISFSNLVSSSPTGDTSFLIETPLMNNYVNWLRVQRNYSGNPTNLGLPWPYSIFKTIQGAYYFTNQTG